MKPFLPLLPLTRPSRQAAALAALGGLVALVVVGVLLDLRRLADERSTPSGGVVPVAMGPVSPPGDPLRDVGSATAGVLPTWPSAGMEPAEHVDHRYRFRLRLMPAWSPIAPVAPDGGQDKAYHLAFEHPGTGARLAITVWPGAGTTATTRERVAELAPGMQSVDGHWPTGAMVGGEPAIIVWHDEEPDQPARYATFVRRAGDLYRIAYSARDGGLLLPEYARALVSLEWSEEDTTDLVPPMPRPTGRFFPPSKTPTR